MIERTLLENLPKIEGFWYIAGPYGSKEKDLVTARMKYYERIDGRLIALGHKTLTPLDKHYKLKYAKVPGTYTFWQEYCMALMQLVSGLIVVALPGWETAVGVQDEIREAKERGIPIYYV